MQCVIICAGKGTRMQPLTNERPKPLVEVCGITLLDHVVAAMPEVVDELVIVVGYKGDMIRTHCGESFHGRPVVYVEQENYAGGTGDALLCAREVIKPGRFLFMYADDIHGAQSLEEAVTHEYAILAAYAEEPQHFGVLVEDDAGCLTAILEKPKDPPSNKVNIGGMVLDEAIFTCHADTNNIEGELYVTDLVTEFAKTHPMKVVTQTMWIPVSRPEDIAKAEAKLCPK